MSCPEVDLDLTPQRLGTLVSQALAPFLVTGNSFTRSVTVQVSSDRISQFNLVLTSVKSGADCKNKMRNSMYRLFTFHTIFISYSYIARGNLLTRQVPKILPSTPDLATLLDSHFHIRHEIPSSGVARIAKKTILFFHHCPRCYRCSPVPRSSSSPSPRPPSAPQSQWPHPWPGPSAR